ncbi:hypothetical protein [Lewinella sp. LCG006]|uniref:hypothetical protein n=1 Tax=Lewinella sp. LCG006 TaxID=3231911 RepID=UPI00345F2C25
MDRRKKYRRKTSYPFLKVTIFLFLFSWIGWVVKSYVSLDEYEVLRENNSACLEYKANNLTGIVVAKGYLRSKSKLISIQFSNEDYFFPYGQGNNLKFIAIGDSLVKPKGTFDFIIYKGEAYLDSIYLPAHPSINCK